MLPERKIQVSLFFKVNLSKLTMRKLFMTAWRYNTKHNIRYTKY